MPAEEQARFLTELAEDLNTKNIRLPSFRDVVLKIRTALEDPGCTSEQLAGVVRMDAVLVARLLMAANSAFHNRAGIEIVDLDLAMSRLGFEVVRNTAITLAVEQIFVTSEHELLKSSVKTIWNTSLSMASMSFVLARNAGNINADNAFLSGLLHEIGKLYILTKARDYPALLGDEASLKTVLDDWHPSIGKSIVEAWGFSTDIADSVEVDDNVNSDPTTNPTLADVVHLAKSILAEEEAFANSAKYENSAEKLNFREETYPVVQTAFDQHLQSLRQSVG